MITLTKVKGSGCYEIGYWVRGELQLPLSVGSIITLNRSANSRHPDGFPGIFASSQIKEILGDSIVTENSIWKLAQN